MHVTIIWGAYQVGLGGLVSREQADVVGNDARRSHARPEGLHAPGITLVTWHNAQILRRVLCIVGVVGGADGRLVGNNVDVAETCELLHHRRDVGVADQNVLVFFLHQFLVRSHNHFYHVLAGGQHGGAVGRISYADYAVRTGTRSGRSVD